MVKNAGTSGTHYLVYFPQSLERGCTPSLWSQGPASRQLGQKSQGKMVTQCQLPPVAQQRTLRSGAEEPQDSDQELIKLFGMMYSIR